MSKKIITGVKSTGSSMHLGNLMGAVLPFGRTAVGNDAAIFIADLHSLTSVKDGKTLREQTLEVATEYLAIYGLDTPITIFRQSDIHQITQLMWILTNVTPYSLMLRAHGYKDFQQKIDDLKNQISNLNGAIQVINKLQNGYTEKPVNDPLLQEQFLETCLVSIKKSTADKDLKEILLTSLEEDFDKTFNMGVFNYPILMAADIIGYDCEAVPVGRDQIQHLEMTRDIVRAFNRTYGQEVFIEPEAIVDESVATLPGIDGSKMSKSYDNFIGIFDDDKTLKKRVMSIVTDSLGMDEVKNPDTCNVFALIQVFGTPDEVESIRQKYLTPNMGFGYGHAKTALLDILIRYLSPYRIRREQLLLDIPFVEAKLAEGARVMNARLDAKMQVVKEVVGVN